MKEFFKEAKEAVYVYFEPVIWVYRWMFKRKMIQLTCKSCSKQFGVETLKNVLIKVTSPNTGEEVQVPACADCREKLLQRIEDTRVIFFFGNEIA